MSSILSQNDDAKIGIILETSKCFGEKVHLISKTLLLLRNYNYPSYFTYK